MINKTTKNSIDQNMHVIKTRKHVFVCCMSTYGQPVHCRVVDYLTLDQGRYESDDCLIPICNSKLAVPEVSEALG